MKEQWINIAKAMAILAVMVDHTNGILYTDSQVAMASYYSVSLFILIMGITSYWSFKSSSGEIGKKILRRGKKIIIAYTIAVAIYCIVVYKQLDFMTVIVHFINFNASAPHYYVILYLQLLLLSPIVYLLVRWSEKDGKNTIMKQIFGGGWILFIASWTTNHSNILNIYGGGGKIAGGTYLFILYLGMLIGAWYNKLKCDKLVINFICMIIFGFSAILVWRFMCIDNLKLDSRFPFGAGFNPPSISFIIYALVVLFTIFYMVKLLVGFHCRYINRVIDAIDYIGKHTLYIFLYHRLFLDFYLCQINFGERFWLKRGVYFGVMIVGALIIENIIKKIEEIVVMSFKA